MNIIERRGSNLENINNEHDVGYKFLLSSKKVFLQLLRSFVNKDWVDQIEENQLEKTDKSYILQDFGEKEADLVYHLQIKDREVVFYVLLELQSKVDFQMPFRLLAYMMEIWRDILKNTHENKTKRKSFKLTIIYSIVLYNVINYWNERLNLIYYLLCIIFLCRMELMIGLYYLILKICLMVVTYLMSRFWISNTPLLMSIVTKNKSYFSCQI